MSRALGSTALLARLAAPAALCLLAACGGGGASSPTGSSTPAPSTPGAPASTATSPSSGMAPIFDPSVLHDARLELDPSAWQALRDNYLTNQYYAANLSVDGVAVAQVGVRSRGSGSRSEQKPGLKVDFNKYVAGQEYYGYKSLVIDNLTQDPSMLRERLAFLVFEAMGIQSPYTSFARLTVNGEYWGLFALVEPVSKPFLKSRLGEESGTLYDYTWSFPYDFAWLGGTASAYVPLPFQPETNEDHPELADGLVAFIEAINDLPEAGFASAIGARLDVDRFLTHVAVENAIAERDGVVGDQGLNNFYLYEYGQKNRFVFVPWDKDNTFRSGSWPLYRNLEDNVLTRRLTGDPAKRTVYADAVVRTTTNYLNPRWLTPQLESAYQQIRTSALADGRKPFTNGQFEAAVDGVRGVIAAREHDVNAQR
jgi:spore coat protein CotH